PTISAAGQRYSRRGSYKGPRRNNGVVKWIALGAVVLLVGGVLGAVALKPQWFKGKPSETSVTEGKKSDPAEVGPRSNGGGPTGGERPGTDSTGNRPPKEDRSALSPRRMLAISINNYLYANPLQFGLSVAARDNDRRDFYRAADLLAEGWRIPKSQRYFISDM